MVRGQRKKKLFVNSLFFVCSPNIIQSNEGKYILSS